MINNPATGFVSMNTGSYVGDNNANKGIAHGLGAIPKFVHIFASGYGLGWQNVEYSAKVEHNSATLGNRSVTAMDSTYFYVGDGANHADSQNANGVTYYWIAMS